MKPNLKLDVGVHFNPYILLTCGCLFWWNTTFLSLPVLWIECKLYFLSLYRSGRIPSRRTRAWPSSSLWTRAGNYLIPSSDPLLAASSLSPGLQRYVACVQSGSIWEEINVMWKGDQQGDLEFKASVNNMACSRGFPCVSGEAFWEGSSALVSGPPLGKSFSYLAVFRRVYVSSVGLFYSDSLWDGRICLQFQALRSFRWLSFLC